MKNLLFLLLVLPAVAMSNKAVAANETNILANCLIDSLNGKERKQLAKWVFLAIAAHPEIETLSNASSKDRQQSDQTVGQLITRLLTENCPTELVKANNADPMAINHAFELVGKVAMQELMNHQATMEALTNYVNYTDQAKINTLLGN